MSLHAYEDEWRIQRFLNTYRLRLKKWNMAANVNLPAFFIAEDPYNGTLYISVRGTQHVNDVFTSFQTNVTRLQVYRNHSHVLVHAGFLHSAKCILEKEIAPVLQRNPNRNIILTGHSLGGAVATLLTVLLVRGRETAYPYKSLRAVTYGAPPSVASNLHLPELLSVSMEGDLVPRLSMQNAMLIRDFYLNTSCPSNHFDQTPPLDALLVPGTIYWIYPGGGTKGTYPRKHDEAFVRIVDQVEHNKLVLGWHIFEHHTLAVYKKNLKSLRDEFYKDMFRRKAEHEHPESDTAPKQMKLIKPRNLRKSLSKGKEGLKFCMNILGSEYEI
eukprot:CAMPEP_0184503470 /NCGR_PEP_ID=MMETSP0113_2-20130426/51908_1 /TAXON_ID=91329 /ORGANISM="Norrisiella sphaerica, Strain BC52" /LENGTH=327 /DNA_ID=CAMNT_0026892967 /DNA_START=1217 /DNA_END=2200 /DNA_ORIENTATION=+